MCDIQINHIINRAAKGDCNMNDYSLGTTFVVIPFNQIKMMHMFMCR